MKGPVRDILERAGVVELLGPDGIQPSVRIGVNAFLRRNAGRSGATIADDVATERPQP